MNMTEGNLMILLIIKYVNAKMFESKYLANIHFHV
jgi:hypothetical protein